MQDQVNATPTIRKRAPWNKGKLTGAKPPLRPKYAWSIRTKLQIEGRVRDLAMFNRGKPGRTAGIELYTFGFANWSDAVTRSHCMRIG
jgi:hypothetical protein